MEWLYPLIFNEINKKKTPKEIGTSSAVAVLLHFTQSVVSDLCSSSHFSNVLTLLSWNVACFS
jgi:hypothetical protein